MHKQISVSVRSDMGRIRKNNEDNLLCDGRYMRPEEVNTSFRFYVLLILGGRRLLLC